MSAETEPHHHDIEGETKRFFTFVNVILILTGLTFIELLLIKLPTDPILLAVALVVLSIMKFVAVVAYFMHLRWDHKLHSAIFMLGLLLASGTVIVLILLFEAPPAEVGAELVE